MNTQEIATAIVHTLIVSSFVIGIIITNTYDRRTIIKLTYKNVTLSKAVSKFETEKTKEVYVNSLIKKLKPNLDPVIVSEITQAVNKYSTIFSLPPELIIFIIREESGFRPTAISKNGHDRGLMGINISVHQDKIDKLGLKDFEVFYIGNNIRLGCEILKGHIDRTKTLNLALKGYVGANGNNREKYVNRIISGFANSIIKKERK